MDILSSAGCRCWDLTGRWREAGQDIIGQKGAGGRQGGSWGPPWGRCGGAWSGGQGG